MRKGIILDGPDIVGYFDSFNAEDSYGTRRIHKIQFKGDRITSDDFDFANQRMKRSYNLIYGEASGGSPGLDKVITNLGYGIITRAPKGRAYALPPVFTITEAIFERCPRGFQHG